VVAHDRYDVGVPGDDPELVPRIPVNGVDRVQTSDERVRVPDRVAGEQVVEVNVFGGCCH
jgi:hypothetical protein